jgi:glycosyltransferase involved in cell wall biosynthesis
LPIDLKVKILHAILTDQFYGSERYCAELAALQAARGHHVQVVLQSASAPYVRAFQETIAPTAAIKAAVVSAVPQSGSVALTTIPGWLPHFLHRPLARRFVSEFSPDIVHSHLDPAARRVGRVAQRLGIPHVATLHLDYHDREYADCEGLICIAEWQRRSIPADFAGAIAVVPNWLPIRVSEAIAATSAEAAEALRRTWNAQDTTMVFGSIGRLLPEKGMDVLVDAFRQAFPRGDENARLILVGDGPRRREIPALCGGDARIVLAGWQSEVAAYYRAFDVYVSAARFEPFGLTIPEAMAAGCPLILTRAQGPREFVHDPQVRWCAPGEVAPLADLILKETERRRRRLKYNLSAFSPTLAVAAIEALYHNVLARRRA